jgi:Mce-associated membrane protein
MTTTSEPDADDADFDEENEADEADKADEEDEREADDQDGPARRRRPRTSTVLVTLAVLFMLACGAFAWSKVNQLGDQAAVPEEARQAAMRFAVDLGTYDYRDPDGNFELVAVHSTDNFARQLVEITDALGPLLQETKAISTAEVAAASVLSSDEHRAVIDLYLDQTIENADTPAPRVDRNRMELTVVNVGGVWQLDQVETR